MQAEAHHRLRRALRALGHIARRTPWRLAVFAALALVATWPMLRAAPQMNTFRDAQVLVAYEDAARKAVVEHGQAPLWDPYYCGGMYALGSPQSRFASPTFLFTLLFGALRGEPLTVFAMIVLGLEGAFRLARSLGASSLAAVLVAPAFALSGSFAAAPAMGWLNFMGFELLPWAVFGLRRALAGRRWGVAVCAGALAWIVGMGGTYAAPIAALLCAFETAAHAWRARRDRAALGRIAAMAAIAGACAVALSAVRLWPVLETLRMAPRIIGGAPGNHGLVMLRELLLPLESGKGGGNFGPDGAFYVGAALAAPAVIGALTWRGRPLLVAAFFAMWLASGYASVPSLFDWLRALPLYSTLRYPERFLIPFAMYAVGLGALGLTALLARRSRASAWAFVAAAALLALDAGVLVRNHWFAASARQTTAAPPRIDRAFHQARGTRWAAALYPPMSRGSLSCWDAFPVPQSPALRADLADETYVADPGAGAAKTTRWSPARVDFEADLSAPARVRVNQNWHPGWTASSGEVVSDDGLVAVALPAGKHVVTLAFRPRSGLGGGAVSLVALAACAAIAWRGRRARKGHALDLALAAAPAAALALVVAAWKEPPIPDRSLVTPAGEAVVVDAPPDGSTPAGATFDGGVELVAVRVTPPDPAAGGTATIELDWRVTGRAPGGVGVFMHAHPEVGERMTADHATISGVLELEKAPRGKVLRDVAQLSVPDNLSGKTIEVWVGLWIQRGRGTRLHVTSPGALTVKEDRALVTTLKVR